MRTVREIENLWIDLPDGCRLAARIWMPEDAERRPVPAIFEYLPYRKRDGTAERDALTHPWFAAHGYTAVRVDMRGSGDSEGVLLDEYLQQELDDGVAVIAWIAAQPWCSGAVGMIGISWGGFNGLQIAALQPPALKAVISLASSVDRYADDIHYRGGCLLTENLGWASTMLSYMSRPPDPALVGEPWRAMWLERLEAQPHLAETWLTHRYRDAYWKHGSICEDYAAVRVPVLAVCGWADGYSDTVFKLVSNLTHTCCKGIIGPWIHKYPHFAVPAPRIGFLQEALRWWDRWLKDELNRVEDDPAIRAFCQTTIRPRAFLAERPGRWIAERSWPPADEQHLTLHLGPNTLTREPAHEADTLSLEACEDTGEAGGVFCSHRRGPELPGDQRLDDVRSLVFETAPLERDLEILGFARVALRLAVDRPDAHLAVRLNAIAADGTSLRVALGLLDLHQRHGPEKPAPMSPGVMEAVSLTLDACAHRLSAGERLRLSISTAYWPLLWPDPLPVTLTLEPAGSRLELPVRDAPDVPEWRFEEPQTAAPAARVSLREPRHERLLVRDLSSDLTITEVEDDFGLVREAGHGLEHGHTAFERYSIDPADPLSAVMETRWQQELARGDWRVSTIATARMTATPTNYQIEGAVTAFEGDTEVHEKSWRKVLPRRP